MSSLACGLAPNLATLIAFRIIQGATGGGLQPLSQAIMLEAFPPQDRGKAMAFWGFGIVVAPMLGPVLGGWITDTYSWRWIFYLNLPIGIAATIMAKLFVFDPPYIRRTSNRIDYWGFGLLIVGMSGLQIMLDKGQQEDWFSSKFIVVLAVDGDSGPVGIHHSRKHDPGPGSQSQGVSQPDLCHRHIHDDGSGLCALRQHRVDTHLVADADGLSGATGGDGRAASRLGFIPVYADCRHPDEQGRAAQAALGRLPGGGNADCFCSAT